MVTISGRTRLMGVIGDPIVQAKTPGAIEPHFARHGADIACVPFHIPPSGLEAAWAGLKAMPNIVGFGVTLPHKQAILPLCDSLDPLAELGGAVNLVRRERDGSFRGYQFDGQGFLRGLEEQGIGVEGRECLMIGAGGAAIAIAFALEQAGAASLVVANRTEDKAQHLAQTLADRTREGFARAGAPVPETGQLIINATSLGLNADDPLPLDAEKIDATMTVAEVIAEPETTRLLHLARKRGARTHSGIHMIRGQVGLIADHFCELYGSPETN
ncbi:shikimate dehydrogenase family protein [Jiella marina]|uniref:shikimate dehydrogenase family protein n=1 Tax=Jiella sp. LLJ827 TaxID=2917712 RepID=UPI002101A2A7|nr:shikimate dehydrogenase [Jiella sp. LLJ827]MCQ0986050.1 shikimate dehydrogenase [Jiella sp. LLJ827]